MQLPTAALVSVICVVLVACASRQAQVEQQAAERFGCPSDQLEVTRRTADTFVVTGCDRQGVFQCVRQPVACTNLLAMARERAASEFQCRIETVNVTEISPFVFRVGGCAQAANYHCEVLDRVPRCLSEVRR